MVLMSAPVIPRVVVAAGIRPLRRPATQRARWSLRRAVVAAIRPTMALQRVEMRRSRVGCLCQVLGCGRTNLQRAALASEVQGALAGHQTIPQLTGQEVPAAMRVPRG